jgi:hypothetical protein
MGDIAAVLGVPTWAVISAICGVVSVAGVLAMLAGQIACEWISRRWQARRGIRRLESYANHPSHHIRKEKP